LFAYHPTFLRFSGHAAVLYSKLCLKNAHPERDDGFGSVRGGSAWRRIGRGQMALDLCRCWRGGR